MRLHLISFVAGATLLAPNGATHAQSIAQRIASAGPDVAVHFTYEAKPGVCGNGDDIMVVGGRAGEGITVLQHVRGNVSRSTGRDNRIENCRPGPVTIELTRRASRITEARVRVGATDLAARDLGAIPPVDAVSYLLNDAVRTSDRRAGERLIFASTLANAEAWPGLLTLARDRAVSDKLRETAIFWLGQAAGEKATEGLTSVIGDDSDEMEVRKSAVFALSQIKAPETIDALIRIARTNREPELRKNAIFWLAQTHDPKVVAFFEEILRGN